MGIGNRPFSRSLLHPSERTSAQAVYKAEWRYLGGHLGDAGTVCPVYSKYRWRFGRSIIEPAPESEGPNLVEVRGAALPSAVYRLYEGDTEAVWQFVHLYGLLGYHQLSQGRRRLTTVERALAELLSWIGVNVPEDYGGEGDPLVWVFAHARGVRFIMDGLLALAEHNEEAALGLISRMLPDPKAPADARQSADFGIGDGFGRFRPHTGEPMSPLNMLRHLVQEVLDANLQTVMLESRLGQASRPFTVLVSRALISSVYLELSKGEIYRCEACHLPFVKTDPRQRFCPPGPHEKESRCAMRHRQQSRRRELVVRIQEAQHELREAQMMLEMARAKVADLREEEGRLARELEGAAEDKRQTLSKELQRVRVHRLTMEDEASRCADRLAEAKGRLAALRHEGGTEGENT